MNDPANDPLIVAIRQLSETRDTEFKESQPFANLRWKLLKTCMAMANLRDGGQIVIGISERHGRPERTGISVADSQTYNQDDLIGLVNRHARPPVSLLMRFVEYEGRQFVGVVIGPFERTPVMCFRDTPAEADNDRLLVGNIPVRSLDRIATTRLVDYELLSEILENASEKRAAEIISLAQRIGLRMPADAEDRIRRERRDFGDFD